MTDLTDKLEKGELPEGWYYLKVNEELANYPVIAECVLMSQFSYFYDFDEAKIEQVLAPVPSYEEWQSMDRLEKIMLQERARLNKQVVGLLEENTKLKERVYEFVEANQSLRKKLDEERAKNRIDYYDGSPMDFLDECEQDRKKNKIYKNLINNIRKELIISDLRRTDEGNKFIVGILSKINQALGEDK